MLEIQTIGLFHCKVGGGSGSSGEAEVIQIIPNDSLSDYPNVDDVTRDLLGTLIGKDFIGKKSARVHPFSEEASKPRDISARSTLDLLDIAVKGEEIEDNFETLASWYLQTDYAQSGLLIITRFITSGEPQIGIIKAPFMDDVYEPDDDQVLTEMDQVIKGSLKKGILYPRITPEGDSRKEEACVYQSGSATRYPTHWYEYLHLEPNKTADQILAEQYKEMEDDNPLDDVESTEDFEETYEEINEDVRGATVTVQIGNTEVRVKLKEILKREGIKLIEGDDGYYLILTGDKPVVKFYDAENAQYREILTGLESYDSLDILQS